MDNVSYLLLVRSSPYGSARARAAIDIALTAAAFEQAVTVVFLDEGVLQLFDGQETDIAELKNISQMIPALPIYDVKSLCVHLPSAEKFGLDVAGLAEITPLDDAGLTRLTREHDQVLVF